jgi:hypothetical protein
MIIAPGNPLQKARRKRRLERDLSGPAAIFCRQFAFVGSAFSPRVLPLLISAFAIPISLSIALLFGLSCIVVMAVLVFVMFSPEQDIIAADTGPAANMAAIAAAANACFM